MRELVRIPVLCCALLGVLVAGCVGSSGDPAAAQTTYGASVDATEAVPAPAVAAEESLYVDRVLSIDGRLTAVKENGCGLQLDTGDDSPLFVTSARTTDGSCTWQVPDTTDGFAVATGTLRVERDTLRLSANGVQVTPVRLSEPDS